MVSSCQNKLFLLKLRKTCQISDMKNATCVENDKENYQTVCYYRVEYVTMFIVSAKWYAEHFWQENKRPSFYEILLFFRIV